MHRSHSLLAAVAVAACAAGCHGTARRARAPAADVLSARDAALSRARVAMKLYRADVAAALAEAGPNAAIQIERYREHLEALTRLEEVLEAHAGCERPRRGALAPAALPLAEAAFFNLHTWTRGKALALSMGRRDEVERARMPEHIQVAMGGAPVVEALLPLIQPPRDLDEAQVLVTVAAVHVLEGNDPAGARELARNARAAVRQEDGQPRARWTKALARWVEGQALLQAGDPRGAVAALSRAEDTWSEPHVLYNGGLAEALEAVGRRQDAAVQWALVELTQPEEGRLHLERLSDRVDVGAARAAPEVTTQRQRRARALAEWQARKRAARRPLASLWVTDSDTGKHSLDELRGGRPAAVVFWTRHCAPCLEELPVLARLRAQLDGLAILTINGDEAPIQGQLFLEEMGWALPFHHMDVETAKLAAGVNAWPTTVLLDGDGRECHRQTGFRDARALEMLLRAHAEGRCGLEAAAEAPPVDQP